jgi:hypothetical protein
MKQVRNVRCSGQVVRTPLSPMSYKSQATKRADKKSQCTLKCSNCTCRAQRDDYEKGIHGEDLKASRSDVVTEPKRRTYKKILRFGRNKCDNTQTMPKQEQASLIC